MGIFYKNDGAVTVFFALLLIPILILAGIAVDAVRIYGAKAIVSDSTELAMNTALASYNQILKDVYGILSISSDENELSNNLVKYFENTVNSMCLDIDEEDSYTKTIIEDIKNLISSPEKFEFNNLIDMETVNFTAKGIEGTQLYYSEAVKRQLVEYMKYRGVISIGSNFLDKLNIFKEVTKQQQVIESKVEYENTLSNIDSACKEAYMAISEYDRLEGELSNYTIENFHADAMNGNGLYAGIRDINKLLILVYSNEALSGDLSKIDVSTTDLSYPNIYSYLNSATSQNIINSTGKLDDKKNTDEKIKYFFDINKSSYDIVKIIKYHEALPEKFNNYKSELIKIFERREAAAREEARKNKLPYEPGENTELIDAENEYSALVNTLNTQIPVINTYKADIESRKSYIGKIIENELEKLNSDLHKKYLLVSSLAEQADMAGKKSEDLLKDIIPEVEQKNSEWRNNLSSLTDGDIKKSLEMQYEDVSKALNKDDIKKLKDIMQNNRNYYEKYKKILDDVKYLSKLFIKEKLDIKVNSLSKSISFSNEDFESSMDEAEKVFADIFCFPDIKILNEINKESYKQSAFYKYLNKIYASLVNKNLNTEARKAEVKAKKENLFDMVNTTVSTYENEIKNKAHENTIPAEGEIYDDLATTLINASLDESVDDVNKLSSNHEENKKVTENQISAMKNSLGAVDGLLGFAGNLTEGVRDNLFVAEYMAEMFSCHTTNMVDLSEKTLSGIELSSDNNYLYGSELEYILWGQNGEKTNKNNIYTTTSIFGLRFILNTIYAYTDMEIKTFTLAAAISLAGFTGFGVPIVQNILILALAMGESALDITRLLKGENVVLYKTYTSWILKPSGISKEAVSYTLKTVTDEALDKLSSKIIDVTENTADEAMRNLEEAFDEYSESLADDLAVSVSNLILTPVQTELTVWIETSALASVESFSSTIDAIYNKLIDEISDEPESFLKNVKLIVFDMFIKNNLEELKSQIINDLTDLSNDIEGLKIKAESYIKTSVEKLAGEAKSIIFENGYEELKNQAKQSFYGMTDDIKQSADKIIDDFVKKVFIGDIASGSTSINSGISANFTVNYKEYIKIFLFSGMVVGKDSVYISRMCDLIKLNMVCSANAPMPGFMLKNSYTMLKIDTVVSARTTFMRHKLFANPWDDNKCYVNYSTVYGY